MKHGPAVLIGERMPVTRYKADYVIFDPPVSHLLSPVLTVVPLQFLTYYMALEKSCDVDQPRNLVKSVTA